MTRCPRITIAGLGGDTGKTVVSVGLCRFLTEKGLHVTPFKKGPDYIDMEWLRRGASHDCYNVDLFLMGAEAVLSSFCSYSRGSDISIIEGNRGIYDGMDIEGSVSTAEVAKLLHSPIILVIDCTKVTRTVAALVMGCQVMDPEVMIAGVILNKVAGSRHESTVRKTVERYCRIPVVGAIPKLKNLRFPGRHLGLVPPQEHPDSEEALTNAAGVVGSYVDGQKILEMARESPPLECPTAPVSGPVSGSVTIGVIRDAAFQFYYPENLDALRDAGAKIVEFSALTDALPSALDALYIGGGFPETHAAMLSENARLRKEIKRAADRGLPIYAECGGLMYLARELIWEGKAYPMANVFPAQVSVSARPRGHGYSIVHVTGSNPFFAEGSTLRGHEFHYSYISDLDTRNDFSFVFSVMKGTGIRDGMDGMCYRNVLATYHHLHAAGTPQWVQGMVAAASLNKNKYLSAH